MGEAAPVEVEGGWLHTVLRVTTDHGDIAIKVLNPRLARSPEMVDRFRQGERIAAAMAEGGVPAVTSLRANGDPLTRVEDALVAAYPWHGGDALGVGPAPTHKARVVGQLLAKMHALVNRPRDLAIFRPTAVQNYRPEARWRRVIAGARECGLDCSRLDHAFADLLGLQDEARRALPALTAEVVSHCDLDKRNVLWGPEPSVIDWELAGPISAGGELMDVALEWSGQYDGPPRYESFRAVLEGYRDEGRTLPDDHRLLYGRVARFLRWLYYNVESYPKLADDVLRARAQRAVNGAVKTLCALHAGLPTWREWISC